LVFGGEFAIMSLVTKTVVEPLPKEANHGEEEKEGGQEEEAGQEEKEGNQEEEKAGQEEEEGRQEEEEAGQEAQEEEVSVANVVGPLTPSHEDRRPLEGHINPDGWPRLKPAPFGAGFSVFESNSYSRPPE
jgi:hypothetical protein